MNEQNCLSEFATSRCHSLQPLYKYRWFVAATGHSFARGGLVCCWTEFHKQSCLLMRLSFSSPNSHLAAIFLRSTTYWSMASPCFLARLKNMNRSYVTFFKGLKCCSNFVMAVLMSSRSSPGTGSMPSARVTASLYVN